MRGLSEWVGALPWAAWPCHGPPAHLEPSLLRHTGLAQVCGVPAAFTAPACPDVMGQARRRAHEWLLSQDRGARGRESPWGLLAQRC